MSVVGIDFGNRNCVIAVAQKGGVDTITNEVSNRQTPCMISFKEGERAIGESSLTQLISNTRNTIYDLKRLIGRRYQEPEIQDELKWLPFKTKELADGSIGVEAFYQFNNVVFRPEQLVGAVLGKLKQIAEVATRGKVKDVVISVPVWWNTTQRRAMLHSAEIADLNCLRLLNDTTSSAISYGIYKRDLPETDPLYVLFFDMGHSNTSACVAAFTKGKLKIISSAYDRSLGGRNFDMLMAEHFSKQFQTKYKIDVMSNARARLRLLAACERAKKVLTTNPQAPIDVECIMEEIDVHGMIERAELESLASTFFPRIQEVVRRAVKEAGLQMDQLHSVELVGGSSRVAAVRHTVEEVFGRPLSTTLNFEEAVAKGCALQCAVLSPVFRVREFSIIDANLLPIHLAWKGISDPKPHADDQAVVFPKYNVIPSPKMITFSKIEPIEMIASYADPSMLPAGADIQIGHFSVPQIVPQKSNAVSAPKIKCKIKLTSDMIFVVENALLVETLPPPEEATMDVDSKTAKTPASPASPKEAATSPEEKTPEKAAEEKTPEKAAEEEKKKPKNRIVKTPLRVIPRYNGGLAPEELVKFVELEGKMQADDRLAIETADARNLLESYCYDNRDNLSYSSLGNYATEEEKQKTLAAFQTASDWLYTEEAEEATKSTFLSKLDEVKVLCEPIRQRRMEFENLPAAFISFKKAANAWMDTAKSEDSKYAHISHEERDKVLVECQKAWQHVESRLNETEQQPKTVLPVINSREIKDKQAALETTCFTIMNKPKPLPPKEEPKKEESEPMETDKSKAASEESNQEAPANGPPGDMDVE